MLQIPFPKISLTSRLFASTQANLAQQEQRKVKECVTQKDDKPKKVFNLQWKYKNVIINEGETEQKVMLAADTWGYEDMDLGLAIPNHENVTYNIKWRESTAQAQVVWQKKAFARSSTIRIKIGEGACRVT